MGDIVKDTLTNNDRNFFLTLFIYLDILLCAVISFTYLSYIINSNPLFVSYPAQCIIYPALSLLSIFFLVKILKWEQDGLWGILAVSVISLIINFSMPDLEDSNRYSVLITPVILYLIMQIKKNGVSAWNHIYNSEKNLKQ